MHCREGDWRTLNIKKLRKNLFYSFWIFYFLVVWRVAWQGWKLNLCSASFYPNISIAYTPVMKRKMSKPSINIDRGRLTSVGRIDGDLECLLCYKSIPCVIEITTKYVLANTNSCTCTLNCRFIKLSLNLGNNSSTYSLSNLLWSQSSIDLNSDILITSLDSLYISMELF